METSESGAGANHDKQPQSSRPEVRRNSEDDNGDTKQRAMETRSENCSHDALGLEKASSSGSVAIKHVQEEESCLAERKTTGSGMTWVIKLRRPPKSVCKRKAAWQKDSELSNSGPPKGAPRMRNPRRPVRTRTREMGLSGGSGSTGSFAEMSPAWKDQRYLGGFNGEMSFRWNHEGALVWFCSDPPSRAT